MRRKYPVFLKDLISEHFINTDTFAKGVKEMTVMREWSKAVGEDIVEYTSKLYIRDNILYVSFISPIAKSAFMARQRVVLDRLNRAVGERYILRIRVI